MTPYRKIIDRLKVGAHTAVTIEELPPDAIKAGARVCDENGNVFEIIGVALRTLQEVQNGEAGLLLKGDAPLGKMLRAVDDRRTATDHAQ